MSLLSVSLDLAGAFVPFVGFCLVILIVPLRGVVNVIMLSARTCDFHHFNYCISHAMQWHSCDKGTRSESLEPSRMITRITLILDSKAL